MCMCTLVLFHASCVKYVELISNNTNDSFFPLSYFTHLLKVLFKDFPNAGNVFLLLLERAVFLSIHRRRERRKVYVPDYERMCELTQTYMFN